MPRSIAPILRVSRPVIATCAQAGVNAFDYLVAIQEHRQRSAPTCARCRGLMRPGAVIADGRQAGASCARSRHSQEHGQFPRGERHARCKRSPGKGRGLCRCRVLAIVGQSLRVVPVRYETHRPCRPVILVAWRQRGQPIDPSGSPRLHARKMRLWAVSGNITGSPEKFAPRAPRRERPHCTRCASVPHPGAGSRLPLRASATRARLPQNAGSGGAKSPWAPH